jgi:ADP-heptose:LPS heptosyltransferase
MLRQFKRIIVSRTDRIGDVVLSLPVFASLKECFPDCELIALVQGYTVEVVNSSADVSRAVVYDPAESLLSTIRKLRRLEADGILFLFPRFRLALAAFLAGIPIRVGTAYRWYSFLHNEKVREHRKDSVKSEAEYNLSLAAALGCSAKKFAARLSIDGEGLNAAKSFLKNNRVEKFIVVHPGSGGSAADWSGDNFRKLCDSLIRETDMEVVVTGSTAEEVLCASISRGNPGCINAAGAFSLREFIAFLSLATVFVSNSTGPIHLAASVGTPVVGIYPNNKPMTPARWAPITDKKVILTPPDGSDDLSKVRLEDVLRAAESFVAVKAG